jgi:hypothetical protein
MKNIYVLPTDKPSRLYLWKDKLRIGTLKTSPISIGIVDQNIYITSDEEAKDGDWCIVGNGVDKLNTQFTSKEEINAIWKKIILTTDQDLIKDGVQAIDDEFLEWFVKNPSCEYIQTTELSLFNGDTGQSGHYKYEIIIPKEEPKNGSISECVKVIIDKQLTDIEELKQEVGKVFYESADKTITVKRQETFIKTDNVDGQWLSPVPTERAWQEEKLVEIFGHYPTASPRWQYMNGLIQNSLDAKQMYSEEELRNAMNWMMIQYFEFYECPATGRVNHYIQTIKQQEQ